MVSERRREKRSMSSMEKPPSVQQLGQCIRGSSFLSAALTDASAGPVFARHSSYFATRVACCARWMGGGGGLVAQAGSQSGSSEGFRKGWHVSHLREIIGLPLRLLVGRNRVIFHEGVARIAHRELGQERLNICIPAHPVSRPPRHSQDVGSVREGLAAEGAGAGGGTHSGASGGCASPP